MDTFVNELHCVKMMKKKLKLGLIAKNMSSTILKKAYSRLCCNIGYDVDFSICNLPEDEIKNFLIDTKNDYNGYTVTMPYKQTIQQYLDEISPTSAACSSVNIIQKRNGKLIGYNTDGFGFMCVLNHYDVNIKGKRIVVIGAGGVANAIVYQLSQNGAGEISVFNRNVLRARQLCVKYRNCVPFVYPGKELHEKCTQADIIVNATSLGNTANNDFTDVSFLDLVRQNCFIFDVNYTYSDAILLKHARSLGLICSSGRPMSACQGIMAVKLWTGIKPDGSVLDDLFDK